jgi:hypothetical protein
MSQLLVAMASLLVLQFGSSQRADVVNALSSALADKYVDEAVGKRVAKLLRAKLERGEFDRLTHPEAFAAALTDVLQHETRDRHLWIWYRDGAAIRLQWARVGGPMIARAEVLPGNIGYIDVRHFVGKTAEIDAAMDKVKGAVALMIDLRQCVGGNREQVRHLSAYLFEKPTRLLSRMVRGQPEPIETWTVDQVPGPRLPDVPAYALTSQTSFSAAEGFVLGLRVNGRATVVGERTGGGGHSVDGFPLLPHGFQMLLPVARNIDPRSGKGWEGEGIKPDLEVNPEQALQAAIGHFFGWRQ